jgi:hypothetical protein
MWTFIIVLFVLVLVLGAYVASTSRSVRAAEKVGGAPPLPLVTATEY